MIPLQMTNFKVFQVEKPNLDPVHINILNREKGHLHIDFISLQLHKLYLMRSYSDPTKKYRPKLNSGYM